MNLIVKQNTSSPSLQKHKKFLITYNVKRKQI